MGCEQARKQSFLLRLPLSIREQAIDVARADGISLNHFISLAVAEKLSRMSAHKPAPAHEANPSQPRELIRLRPVLSRPF